jgi:hypothetical protein
VLPARVVPRQSKRSIDCRSGGADLAFEPQHERSHHSVGRRSEHLRLDYHRPAAGGTSKPPRASNDRRRGGTSNRSRNRIEAVLTFVDEMEFVAVGGPESDGILHDVEAERINGVGHQQTRSGDGPWLSLRR